MSGMGRITFRMPAGEHPSDAFAPSAFDQLVGTETVFNGKPATIVAARVLEDDPHYGEITVESDSIGPGDAETTLPPGSFQSGRTTVAAEEMDALKASILAMAPGEPDA